MISRFDYHRLPNDLRNNDLTIRIDLSGWEPQSAFEEDNPVTLLTDFYYANTKYDDDIHRVVMGFDNGVAECSLMLNFSLAFSEHNYVGTIECYYFYHPSASSPSPNLGDFHPKSSIIEHRLSTNRAFPSRASMSIGGMLKMLNLDEHNLSITNNSEECRKWKEMRGQKWPRSNPKSTKCKRIGDGSSALLSSVQNEGEPEMFHAPTERQEVGFNSARCHSFMFKKLG